MEDILRDKKVAIVHQSFWFFRGAERMIADTLELFPDADIFALFGDEKLMKSKFAGHKVKWSWLQKLPFIKKLYRISIPLWPVIFETFDLEEYDLVISFSSSFAKGIVTKLNTKHLSIVFTPPRYFWDLSRWYYEAAPGWRRPFMYLLYTPLRMWDVLASERADKTYGISEFVNKRISKYYGHDADGIIYPPVHLDRCYSADEREDYYLAISPFEEHKNGDLLVKVAVELNLPLKVIGGGNLDKKIKNSLKGHDNVELLDWVDDDAKHELLSKAKGLLYMGVEDFGIVPVEAMASGCPVIAYGKGGALETVEDRVGGVFFDELTVEAVKAALDSAESIIWNSKSMRESVEKFDIGRYKEELSQVVKELISEK